IQRAPELIKLPGNVEFEGKLMSSGDYSYHVSEYAGSHFRVSGDPGAFIDPFFSSGIHLAFTGGLSAASTIATSIREHCTEVEASEFHTSKITTAFTRAILSLRLGNSPPFLPSEFRVLSNCFVVIQGCADVDENLTKEELQNTLDFCENVLETDQPETNGGAVVQ
ncbi:hypothetical protein DFS33DRAFT_1268553, partial [Desarmillaria ectypa]